MEEQERVSSQVIDRNPDDIPSAHKPRMSVSHAPLGLKPLRAQPFVRQGEAHAAVIVLPVIDPNRAAALKDRAELRHAVRNACDDFRQMERRVGVVLDPEEEHLSVEIVHPADRAFGDVGRKRKRIGGDPGGLRPGEG